MTPEDSGSDIGCLGCLAMIFAAPFMWLASLFRRNG